MVGQATSDSELIRSAHLVDSLFLWELMEREGKPSKSRATTLGEAIAIQTMTMICAVQNRNIHCIVDM